jgi:hypothetical protein
MDITKIKHNEQELHFADNGSNKVVIFSHGFGAKWDAKGMFVEIAESLGTNYDYVFFNYNRLDEKGNAYVEELSQQVEVFKNVLEFVNSGNYEEVNIITHSFGAVVPLQVSTKDINKLIILAPPNEVDKKKQRDMLKDRAEINHEGYSSFPRSDGTKTFVHYTFYDSLENIKAQKLFNSTNAAETYIIQALEDEIVSNYELNAVELKRGITMTKIHGDHNFTKENREIC